MVPPPRPPRAPPAWWVSIVPLTSRNRPPISVSRRPVEAEDGQDGSVRPMIQVRLNKARCGRAGPAPADLTCEALRCSGNARDDQQKIRTVITGRSRRSQRERARRPADRKGPSCVVAMCVGREAAAYTARRPGRTPRCWRSGARSARLWIPAAPLAQAGAPGLGEAWPAQRPHGG
jgi:hypothetical protein